MRLTRVVASIALLAVATGAKAVAPVAPFAPNLEYDGGSEGLCRVFLADVQADFFAGAPGISETQTYRKFPQVFADPLSDSLVELNDQESYYFNSLVRYWGDIDGDGNPEEVAMTTYPGDGASGYRTFAGLTKLGPKDVVAVREEWRRLFASGYQDENTRWRGRAATLLNHITENTYIFVVDYGPSTGPNKRFWRPFVTPTRDAPEGKLLNSVIKAATYYRLPFRLIDYGGRLYAETIVDYGWNGDDEKSVAARRVLLSFNSAMQPRPECIIAELPDQNSPSLLLRKSPDLQSLLSVIEAIEGESCGQGTMNISGRHRRERRAIVREVTARPWLISNENKYPSPFANRNMARGDHEWLQIWRLLGPWNAAQFDVLKRRSAKVRDELTDYYQHEFDVERALATEWSREAIAELEGSSALGAASIFRKLEPLAARLRKGEAAADDFVELARGLVTPYRNDKNADEAIFTEALRLAVAARAETAILESLLAKGALLNGGDETPLMNAAGDAETAAALIRLGADADKANGFGKTPLMMAAHLNDLISARLILKHGTEVNAKTSDEGDRGRSVCTKINFTGRTAILYAAENASPKMIKVLLDAGADAKAVDSRNRGALDYLSRNTKSSPRELNKVRRLLIKNGAER